MPAKYTKLYVYPYSLASESARDLAAELATIRVRENGKYAFRQGHLIVNWGSSSQPAWGSNAAYASMLNKPQAVRNAAEKVRTFEMLAPEMSAQLPDWTRSKQVAIGWLAHPIYGAGKKNAVVCRTLTRANSGRGIVLADTPAQVVNAPLYTRYKPKEKEYRVHVTTRYGVVDIQEKRAQQGVQLDETTKYIRAHENHWVFCRENVHCPESVKDAAERAVSILGLDFGAVDVGYHPQYGMAIYEVNTAPGIEGQTLHNYVNVFRRYLQA